MSMLDMVCLGDSIVYGYGVDYRHAWHYLASEHLGLSIMNKGENGDTSAGMNARFMEDVVWNHPKEVFIMAGANDILMGTALRYTCENIDLMIEKALAAGIIPIVGIPIHVDGEMLKKCWYSFFSIEDTINLFQKYGEWLCGYCREKGISYIDFQNLFPEYIRKRGMGRAYQDGVHPTREGYSVLADIFCDEYQKMKGVCE